jgi:hypothetical protein
MSFSLSPWVTVAALLWASATPLSAGVAPEVRAPQSATSTPPVPPVPPVPQTVPVPPAPPVAQTPQTVPVPPTPPVAETPQTLPVPPAPPTPPAPPVPQPAQALRVPIAPPPPGKPGQNVNIRIDLTITESAGAAPEVKSVSMLASDANWGRVRSQGSARPNVETGFDAVVLNVDARPARTDRGVRPADARGGPGHRHRTSGPVPPKPQRDPEERTGAAGLEGGRSGVEADDDGGGHGDAAALIGSGVVPL